MNKISSFDINKYVLIPLAMAISGTVTAPVYANELRPLEEIIVSARKRDETQLSVPVAMTALSGTMLEQRGISDMDGLARNVPQLVIGEGGGTVQGGNIVLRGISGADANPLGDQAVSFNIDNVQVAKATVRRMAEMDIEQIEVLKGPQALFFGKNSPGGVISIRSADPTPELAAKVSLGYEMNAHEWRSEGFVAGPITDNIGFRVAGYTSNMDGWSETTVPSSSTLQPRNKRAPDHDEWALRGTLKFEPTDKFDARIKLTYNERSGSSSAANVQFINCANGTTQFGTLDDCKADDRASVADQGLGFPFGPRSYLEQEQLLAALEFNFQLSDQLTLTSVTGLYDVDLDNVAQYTGSYAPGSILPSQNLMKIRDISQEFHLNSEYDSWFNFTVGGIYNDSHAETGSTTFLGAQGAMTAFGVAGPVPLNSATYYVKQDGKAWSVFAQLMFELTEEFELSVGARASEEEKELTSIKTGVALTPVTLPKESKFDDLSPEITLSYNPSDELMIYASYKEGFLSGGFNGSSGVATASASEITYDQQLIDGFELGAKSMWLEGSLQANIAFYSYDITGLQVTVTSGVIQTLKNAGEVSSEGFEFDFNYQTPVDGLKVYAAAAYSDAQYDDYQATCYRGQTENSAVPCVMQVSRVTNELSLLQDLSGTELVRAPEWSGNLGFNYETAISSGLYLNVFTGLTYSGDYLTNIDSAEHARSPSHTLIDAGISLSSSDDRWKIDLIGKNLTEEYYWTRGTDAPFTGSAPGGTGTGVLGDTVASVSRGREVMLRLTYSFD